MTVSVSSSPGLQVRGSVSEEDAGVVAKYRELDRKGFMSIGEAAALGREIAREAGRDGTPDLVVGIANGALLLTQVVSHELGAPFEIVNVRRKGSRIKQRLVLIKQALRLPSSLVTRGPMALFWRLFERLFSTWWSTELEAGHAELPFEVRGRRVLLVDDCVVTGASVRFVRQQLLAAGALEVRIAAICVASDCPIAVGEPDFPDTYMHRLVHFYPWSANHPAYDDYLAWLSDHRMKQCD